MVNLRSIGLGHVVFCVTMFTCIVVIYQGTNQNEVIVDEPGDTTLYLKHKDWSHKKKAAKKIGITLLNTTLESLTERNSLQEMSEIEVEENFYRIHLRQHVQCSNRIRLGKVTDGGWDMCINGPYLPKQNNCLVYSFGIHNDWSFDDAISKEYGCMVHSFDPSMGVEDHPRSHLIYFHNMGLVGYRPKTPKEWKNRINTLAKIRQTLGHTDVVIDYLKFDIEGSEWDAISAMLADGSLKKVKQLAFETHTVEKVGHKRHVISDPPHKSETKITLSTYSDLFTGLERLGFRRYHINQNNEGRFVSTKSKKTFSCCYEVYYINMNYL